MFGWMYSTRCNDQQSLIAMIAMIAKPAPPEFKSRLTDGSPPRQSRLCHCYNQSLLSLTRNRVIAADGGGEAALEDASVSVQA
jgi:hypothetical protein